MSFVSSFTGSAQGQDLEKAKGKADAAIDTGYAAGQQQYDTAKGEFAPYVETGGKANAMYADAIGINGVDAARKVATDFSTSDPFRQSNADFADKQLLAKENAMGMVDSGAGKLAVARANLERGSTDWDKWLGRISGVQQQGLGVAGSEAGLDVGKGDQSFGYGATKAGNEINYGNAMAANRNTLTNNLVAVGGVAAKALAPSPYNAMKV